MSAYRPCRGIVYHPYVLEEQSINTTRYTCKFW